MKNKNFALKISTVVVYCVLQLLYILLHQYAETHYNGEPLLWLQILSAIVIGTLLWFTNKAAKAPIPFWFQGASAFIWLIISISGLPRFAIWLHLSQASTLLIGFSWLIFVLHGLDFLSALKLKVKEHEKSKN